MLHSYHQHIRRSRKYTIDQELHICIKAYIYIYISLVLKGLACTCNTYTYTLLYLVIFQPVFTVNTSRYFKMKHMANLIEGGHALQVEDQRMPNGSPQSQRNTRFPATGQHKAHSSTPRRIVESMIQWKSKSNLRPTTPLPEGASSPSTLGSEDFFAIQEINMCVHGLWMCVANMGGSVLTFHFKMGEVTTTPKVSNRMHTLNDK